MTALIMVAVLLALVAKGIMKVVESIQDIDTQKYKKVSGDAREGFEKTMTALSNIKKNHLS